MASESQVDTEGGSHGELERELQGELLHRELREDPHCESLSEDSTISFDLGRAQGGEGVDVDCSFLCCCFLCPSSCCDRQGHM